MRGRFLAAVAFALCAVLMNGAQAENIAPGLKVIVLDAGHGGKFPGAHYGKVYEKDLTLAVVLRLGRLIEQVGYGIPLWGLTACLPLSAAVLLAIRRDAPARA